LILVTPLDEHIDAIDEQLECFRQHVAIPVEAIGLFDRKAVEFCRFDVFFIVCEVLAGLAGAKDASQYAGIVVNRVVHGLAENGTKTFVLPLSQLER
jgi:hypothetical protein